MSPISRWKQFPKISLSALICIVFPVLFFLIHPDLLFARYGDAASAILMTITMIGVGLFIILTYLVERRKKYALVVLAFGILFLLFLATVLVDMFSTFVR